LAVVHGPEGSGPPSDDLGRRQGVAALIGLTWLLLSYVFWVPMEWFIYDKYCRFGVMQYVGE
jgi:hypothetical protein